MKTSFFLLNICAGILGLAVTASAAESKRTAEYLLTTPEAYQGKEVTLDVAFVKPVHWVSPLPGVSFFHALTIDRMDRRPGGEILVAVPTDDAAAFARKYGTDFERRYESDSLKGTFMAAGGKEGPRKIWLIDMTGQLQKLIDEKKLQFPKDAFGGPGAGGRRGPHGQS